MDWRNKEVRGMKQKLLDEDVLRMRELFWMRFNDELTQAELESRVNEIAGRQLRLPAEERIPQSEMACM